MNTNPDRSPWWTSGITSRFVFPVDVYKRQTVKSVTGNGEKQTPDAAGNVNVNVDVLEVDETLSADSTNPVENKVVTAVSYTHLVTRGSRCCYLPACKEDGTGFGGNEGPPGSRKESE